LCYAGETSTISVCSKWEAGTIWSEHMVFTNLYLLWYIHNSVFIWFLLSQVKAAHQLLKTIPHSDGSRRVDGVPVFSAQNLDIAIATKDGIKWCVLILLNEKKKKKSGSWIEFIFYLNFSISISIFSPDGACIDVNFVVRLIFITF
jgi:hypothetical protein